MANLTQLRMLENLDGYLLVDKPEGLAFSSVVKAVKRNFNLVKVGHGGSLDAMASGLMVLLINDANKFVDRVMGADRSYAGTIRWGLKTNTGDIRGTAIGGQAGVVPRDEDVARVLPQLKGDVFLTEPRFCSVRKEGTADYEIADTGDHKPFLAHVYKFDLNRGEGDWSFSLSASKGVIVRALVDDLGASLGCGATLSSLRRTRIGAFDVSEAVSFQKLLQTEVRDFASLVQPIARAL